MNLDEEIQRGGEARRIIEHPLYQEAIKSVREGIVSAMGQSALGDEKTHNRLVISLQLLAKIESNLKTVMETGRMAEIQLNESTRQKIRKVIGF